MRLSMMLGLHRRIPEHSPLSASERQHRIRVWWTVYCLDRMMSSKVGHPAMMQDTDIDAELPSFDGLSQEDKADFWDPAYLLAQISLARIVGSVLGNIYHIPHPDRSNKFVQGVQTIFCSLRDFRNGLPPLLRLDPNTSPMYANRSVASLHLHFNQVCPVLKLCHERSLKNCSVLFSPQDLSCSTFSGIVSANSMTQTRKNRVHYLTWYQCCLMPVYRLRDARIRFCHNYG